MDPVAPRRAFIVFHLVLGLGLLVASIETLVHSVAAENVHSHQHLAVVAGIEGIAALLFLIPRTLRLGAVLLVLTIGVAFVLHALRGEFRPDLAVYAAGAWFVFEHGSAWGSPVRAG